MVSQPPAGDSGERPLAAAARRTRPTPAQLYRGFRRLASEVERLRRGIVGAEHDVRLLRGEIDLLRTRVTELEERSE